MALCSAEQNHLCYFGKGIMRNNSMKIIRIWTSGSGGDITLKYFLSRSLATHSFGGEELFVHFG